MPTPRDPELYAKIKRRVQNQFGRWSAYASGSLVQQYKKAFRRAYGHDRAYIGKKSTNDPLTTWFRENWTNVKTGKPCGNAKTATHYPTCRPRKAYAALSKTQRTQMVRRKQQSGPKTTSYDGIL